jgi:hypothetical protein
VWDFIALHGVVERRPYHVISHLALKRTMQLHTPDSDAIPHLRLIAYGGIVAKVIAVAHKRIDGAHSITPGLIEQQKGIVKILRPALRNLAAIAIRIAHARER